MISIFSFSVVCLSEGAEQALAQAGVTKDQVDWLIPHQANIRIIDSVREHLDIATEKVIISLDHHGNTSAASIPLALAENMQNGKFKKGDVLLLTAMGAGFTWGSAVVRL